MPPLGELASEQKWRVRLAVVNKLAFLSHHLLAQLVRLSFFFLLTFFLCLLLFILLSLSSFFLLLLLLAPLSLSSFFFSPSLCWPSLFYLFCFFFFFFFSLLSGAFLYSLCSFFFSLALLSSFLLYAPSLAFGSLFLGPSLFRSWPLSAPSERLDGQCGFCSCGSLRANSRTNKNIRFAVGFEESDCPCTWDVRSCNQLSASNGATWSHWDYLQRRPQWCSHVAVHASRCQSAHGSRFKWFVIFAFSVF